MTEPGQDSRLDRWEHGEKAVIRYAPYATLTFSIVLTLASIGLGYEGGWASLGPTLAVALLAALWICWLVTLHPTWIDDRRTGAIFYAGLLAFAAVLVLRAPWFGFFAWLGYVYAYTALTGRWRFAGIVATAMIAAAAQIGGILPRSVGILIAWLALVLFNSALAGAFAIIGWRNDQQKEIRKQMVADLAEANRQLAATMRENAGLHAQLVTQAREAGVLDERQRMAREIHDTLAQGLIGIVAQLEAAQQSAGHQARWERHLERATRLARDSLTDARRSVQALRPEPLESAQLSDALAGVAQRWSSITEVAADVAITGTARPLHPEVEGTLLRAAQEALSNVAKHAKASRVHLTLSYMEDQVTLDVRDDGVGFDPALPPAPDTGGGFGLTAMRQRVHRLAGQLEIESEPGGGTAISASLPAVPATPPPPARPALPAPADATAPPEPATTPPQGGPGNTQRPEAAATDRTAPTRPPTPAEPRTPAGPTPTEPAPAEAANPTAVTAVTTTDPAMPAVPAARATPAEPASPAATANADPAMPAAGSATRPGTTAGATASATASKVAADTAVGARRG